MKDFAKSIRTNNSSVCNKAIVLKDGNVWVVLYANETKSQEFETEAEAREFAKKVGNEDIGLRPVQGEIEKEVYSVYTQTGKDKEKTKKALKSKHPNLDEQWLDKLLSKLVGNEFVTKSSLQKALREQEQLLKDAEKMLRTKLDPEEKTEWQMAKEDAKKQIERIKEKIGNESIFKQEASMFEGLKKDAEKEIGNETYQHKLYPDKYVIIDGKNYKIITDGKVEKSGELTDAILYGINQTYKRVSSMNSKTGNARLGKFIMEGGHTAELVEEGGKFIIKFDDGNTETFMTRKAADSYLKAHSELYIGNEKTGNETKAERKFGKVMGEFEEGALKTPQGKTVTDPAQAKAIAYSEADKVDNLKRARKAMNNKK